ncbi:hypothetical protein [Larkinella terrae]|uniref:Toxin-antitoxin system HicB family antitoxin n=1 Tax=Larkinella terrae TaxID=2025311 RepID=A0A7K0EID7_9BACT|nr:hypothetical protein [Larkinella terrae]MRS61228.1 hypothetical protein [Larkinella terrae]
MKSINKRPGKAYPLRVSDERFNKMKEKCQEKKIPMNRYINTLIAADLKNADA